jgi:putative membrane protein
VLHTHAEFSRAIDAAVTRIETTTDAELIVVAAERSGSYRDLTYLAASVGTLVVLAVLIFMPWTLHPLFLLVDLVAVWWFLAWLCANRWCVRLLSTVSRRTRQVRGAGNAEFHVEEVHATPDRTGVLIYVSALEGQVILLPDVGLQGRIPKGAWHVAEEAFCHDDLPHFLAGLDAVGVLLAEHVPALERDLIDLPNAPRIRL